MTPEALEALKDSIAHWERKVADPVKEPIGPLACALCQQFLEDGCLGCPVKEKSKRKNCAGTPYEGVSEAHFKFKYGKITIDEFRAACQLELDFLKSLLPKEEAK